MLESAVYSERGGWDGEKPHPPHHHIYCLALSPPQQQMGRETAALQLAEPRCSQDPLPAPSPSHISPCCLLQGVCRGQGPRSIPQTLPGEELLAGASPAEQSPRRGG